MNVKGIPSNDSELPLVSVLFITYKRLDLLRMALDAFRKNTDYPRIEVVIADDGSGPQIQAQIRTLKADVYALAPESRGLGANNNNGVRHCSGKYILMIQDDWECCGPPDYLRQTIQVMEANPTLGIINYSVTPDQFDERMPLYGSAEQCYLTSSARQVGVEARLYYSDQPHVASKSAMEFLGQYDENSGVSQCEQDYCRRWREQTQYASGAFPVYSYKTFANHGVDRSFRTSTFRSRSEQLLLPFAQFLKKRCRPLYRAGRVCLRGAVTFLEDKHLVSK